MADTTTIGPQTHIEGAVSGDGPLHVEGVITGQVTLTEQLTVEPSGTINGEIRVREAVVHGNVQGSLIASERVILTASARVTGHLEAPIIRMDDGAHFTGDVEMVLDGVLPEVSASAAPARTSFTAPTRAAAPTPKPKPKPVETTAAPTKPATVASTAAPVMTSAPAATPAATQTESAPQASSTTTVVVEDLPEEEPDESEEVLDGDPTEYDDHTVKELREELRRRDLPVSGTKQELIERLVESAQA